LNTLFTTRSNMQIKRGAVHYSLTRTFADKSFGWSIGSMAAVATFLTMNTGLHAVTGNSFLSVPICIAAAFIAGIAGYKWASGAKARWRHEESPAPRP
jgi:hypothetical protein